jgi:hypothetical protein
VARLGRGMVAVIATTPSLIRLCTTRLRLTTMMRWIHMTTDERFDRLENMLRSIILNQQVLWDALMEIPDVPNDTKPILKRIK